MNARSNKRHSNKRHSNNRHSNHRSLAQTMALIVALFVSPSAKASDDHYQNIITGGRALGLGGAFTALANDPSGLYYNPAGMVDDFHTDISISADLYGFEQTDYSGRAASPIPGLKDLTKVANDLVIIPTTSGSIHTFQADPNGNGYLNALAFGIFVPDYSSSQSQISLGNGTGLLYNQTTQTDQTLMPGIGYARKINNWRVGLSIFAPYRELESSETVSVSTPTANGGTAYRTGLSTVNFYSLALLGMIGGKWLVNDRLSLGLNVALPDIPVKSNGTVSLIETQANPGSSPPTSGFKNANIDNIASSYRQPLNLRFGSAWVEPNRFTLALDVSLFAPTHYQLLEISDPTAKSTLPFVSDVTRQPVVNFNLGAEFYIMKHYTIAAGFYTDFASSPSLSGPSFAGTLTQPGLSHIDYYGFSAAVGLLSSYTITRIGAVYSFGHGYDVVAQNTNTNILSNQPTYARETLFQSFFYIFLSSTLRLN